MRGLKFCQTPQGIDLNQYTMDINNFVRQLRLREFVHDTDMEDDGSIVRPKSSWEPKKGRDEHLDTLADFLKSYPSPKKISKTSNIPVTERQAIQSLSQDNEITIKEADKGSAIVIMNSQYYEDKINEMLQDVETYTPIDQNIDRKVINKIRSLTEKYENSLTDKEVDFLTKFDYKTSKIYGLPKFHKSKMIIEAIKYEFF